LPDFLKLGSDRAKCKARRASAGNATTLAEYRKAPCNYLNDKEAGQGPRFASISSERRGCIPVSFHWQNAGYAGALGDVARLFRPPLAAPRPPPYRFAKGPRRCLDQRGRAVAIIMFNHSCSYTPLIASA